MWRKYLKKVIYLGIIVIPLFILFFHPKDIKGTLFLDAVVSPVGILQGPVLELKKLYYFHETYDRYVRLKKQNDVLRARLVANEEALKSSERYDKIQEFRRNQNYVSVIANVIGRDPSNWNASLIIDKGEAQGIKLGMPVVSPLGVVGKIFEVGRTTAKVVLVADPMFAVAALVQRTRENGLLTGTLQGVCRLQYLTENADVKVGDKVVASKLSTAFPEGLLIGQVTDVQASTNSHTVECLVDPVVDLSQLEEVIVIKK